MDAGRIMGSSETWNIVAFFPAESGPHHLFNFWVNVREARCTSAWSQICRKAP
jgi:hypothetical protein